MKKRLTRGEKMLVASPLFLIAIAGFAWLRRNQISEAIVVSETDYIWSLNYSPDAKRLLVSFSTGVDRVQVARIYDVKSRSKITDLARPPLYNVRLQSRNAVSYRHFSWSGDGASIVGSQPQELAVWDAQNGFVKANYAYSFTKNDWRDGKIQFSPDSESLVGEGVPPAIYDVMTGQRLNRPDTSITAAMLVRPSDSGKLLARCTDKEHRFDVVDAKTKRIFLKSQFSNFVRFVWSGEILSAYDELHGTWPTTRSHWILWNGKTRRHLPTPPLPANQSARNVRLNPVQSTVVYSFGQNIITKPANDDDGEEETIYDGELVVWDYLANRAVWSRKLTAPIFRTEWSPDGRWLRLLNSSKRSDSLQVFDNAGKLRYENPNVSISQWSPDSKQLAMVIRRKPLWKAQLSNQIEFHRFSN